MGKKIRRVLGMVTFLFLVLGTKVLAEQETVKVGIFDYESFYGMDDDGMPYGYGYEYLDTLADYAQIRYEFVYGSWAQCQEWLENGEIDLLDSAQKYTEREEKFLFSTYSTGTSYGELFVRKDNVDILYNDFEAIDGITVGMLDKNSRNDTFLQYVKDNGCTVKTKTFKTATALSEALQSGDVDAIVSSNLRQGKNERSIARFAPTPFYMMVNVNKPELKERVDEALQQILIEMPSFNAHLNQKYYEHTYDFPMLTKEEHQYIKKAEPLRVIYNANWSPFVSYNAFTKKVEGIHVEVLELVGKKTGLTFTYIHEKDYNKALKMIEMGEADLLLGFEKNAGEEERLRIKSTDHFLSVPLCLVGKNYETPEAAVLAIPANSKEMVSLIKQQFTDIEVVIYDTEEACYIAVQRGEADYALDNVYVATEQIKKLESGGLSVSFTLSMKAYYSFGVALDTHASLLKILNKGIGAITEAEFNSITNNHTINKTIKPNIWNVIYHDLPYIIGVSLGLAAIILCIALMKQRKKKEKLWKTAYIDDLTQIGNMNFFAEEARKCLDKLSNESFALYKMDIESLKLFNEIHGFERGDEIIKLVAEQLKKLSVLGEDAYGRIAKDDFLLLKKYPKGVRTESEKADYERHVMSLLEEAMEQQVKLRFGIYRVEEHKESVSSLLEKTNYAHSMGKSKLNLKYFVYDEAIKQNAIEEKRMEDRMKQALEDKEFVLFLQPKYYLADEALAGAEALVRWKSPTDDSLIYPGSFIPLFERNGFITALDMYMTEQVCILIKQWQDKGVVPVTISINFSRLHILNPYFTRELCELTDRYQIPRKYIEVELTESTMFHNEEAMLSVLDKLHEAGFTLSMDDFGTGYSSLGLLKNLPVDVIKIDRSFFTDNRFKTRAKAVLENVMQMAKQLEIVTVAEGVENKEHIELLHELGCDMVQGYYYAKPMPANKFELDKFLKEKKDIAMPIAMEIQSIEILLQSREEMGNEFSLFVYRLYQKALRKVLDDTYGEGERMQVLREAGRLSGSTFAKQALDISLPLDDFIRQLTEKFSEYKMGFLEVESFDVKTGTGMMSIMADLDCAGEEACGKTLCQYDEGFLAGILKAYTHKNYSVIEIECWGMGQNKCRFEVRQK